MFSLFLIKKKFTASGSSKYYLKKKEWLKLLSFLNIELQALQILQNKKHKNPQLDKNSEICQEVQAMSDTHNIPKSTTSDIPGMLKYVKSNVKNILSKVQKNHERKLLLKNDLNSEQMEQWKRINAALLLEYECCWLMLMQLLDIIVQFFG